MLKLFKTSMVMLLSTCLVLNSLPIYGMDPTGMDVPTIERVMAAYGGKIPAGTDMDVVRTLMSVGVGEKAPIRATCLLISKALELSAPIQQTADINAARVLQLEAEKTDLETNVIPPLRAAAARILELEAVNRQLTTERDQAMKALTLITQKRDQAVDVLLPLTQALAAATKEKDRLEQAVIPRLITEKSQAEHERDEAMRQCVLLRQEIAAQKAANEELYLRSVDSKWQYVNSPSI